MPQRAAFRIYTQNKLTDKISQISHKYTQTGDFMISKNCTLEYRNAIYFGQISHSPLTRHGLGLMLTDHGDVILAQWHNDLLHGTYYYSNGTSSAYGNMSQGNYEGWNVLTQGDLTVWCECKEGLFDGKIVIKMANYEPQAYEFSAGEKITEISLLGTSDPVKTLLPNVEMSLPLFLDLMINQQTHKSTLGAIKFPSSTYYGSVNYMAKCGEGLGFVMSKGLLVSLGTYQNTQLHGLGRRLKHGEEMEDGVFGEGKPAGVVFRWNPKREQYGEYDYSSRETLTISKGTTFPSEQILQMREEFHLRSMKFINDCVSPEDIIKVDLSSIRVSRPESLKARTEELVQKLAHHYLEASPKKFSSPYKKTQGRNQPLSRYKTAERALAHPLIKVSQEEVEEVAGDRRTQQKLRVSEFSPVVKTNAKRDDTNLDTAIREYQELQRIHLSYHK